MGAVLTHMARLADLSIAQNMETACGCEGVQHASRAHIAREKGDLDVIRAELAQINSERLRLCAQDQVSKLRGPRVGQAPGSDGGKDAEPEKGAVA